MKADEKVKILFNLNPEDEQGVETETLWGEPIGNDKFRLLNSPFFIFGVSSEDIVAASNEKGVLTFNRVIARGGHSTYRIYLQDDKTIEDPRFAEGWQSISHLGATFENGNGHFVAVDVPPGKDISAIYKLLEDGEQKGLWAFEEAHYSDHSQMQT